MSDLKLRIIKAKHGDSLLLIGKGAKILIDGGPSGVYNRFLRDQLADLEDENGEPPILDLMMVSHIDADHIDGILDLTDELLEAKEEERDPIVKIKSAWHNSFADVIAKSANVGTASEVRSEAASVAGIFDEVDLPGINTHDSQMVLSSVAQGRQLRLDLKALNVEINRHFHDRLAIVENIKSIWQAGNISIELIGPTDTEIKKLQKEWKKQLKKILKKEADLAGAAKGLDRSVSNLASLVCIVKGGNKSILLTGDARGDMIVKWLEKAGKLKAGKTVTFDVIKLAHHGSIRNASPEFFKRVRARHYVVCGDGKHGNPEPATLKMLFEARPKMDYDIYMTYGPEELNEHKEFKKHKNPAALKKVLKICNRQTMLKYPSSDETYIDLDL
ncbi:MAG: MBL fold metallo-hydrolase [Pseudomonadota bacterium]